MAITAAKLAGIDGNLRRQLLSELSEEEALNLLYDWRFWARPEQLEPEEDWRVWLCLAGRGWGKTRTGAETIRMWVETGRCKRLALVAPTAADARDVMVEGESGILTISPPYFYPHYEPSKRRLTWLNGAVATLFSAEEPDRLRGPQFDGAWVDEIATWRYPDAWDQLMFGLRLGLDPRVVATTTPRPVPLLTDLVKSDSTVISTGSTYDNIDNLAEAFVEKIVAKYEGTRLGRQEIYAEILTDVPGALWKREIIEQYRVRHVPVELVRVVVAVDPAASESVGAAKTGIVVAGLGEDGHGYVLDDISLHASPDGWAKQAVAAYYRHGADRIVAEVNNGGDMVGYTVRTVDPKASYKSVRASRGKQIRAEPVAALYEQGKVHHVGYFGALEDQLCTWVPEEKSPDRLDALVWALTELLLYGAEPADIF